jgi:hypothetical protein
MERLARPFAIVPAGGNLADSWPHARPRHQAARRMLLNSSNTRRNARSGATHVVRYVLRKASHEIQKFHQYLADMILAGSNSVLAGTRSNALLADPPNRKLPAW